MGRRSKWEDKIINLLIDRPMAYKELKSVLRISDRVLNYNLRKLMDSGRIYKAGRKYYVNTITVEETIKTNMLSMLRSYKLSMWSPYVYVLSIKPLKKYKTLLHPALCSSIWSWMSKNIEDKLINDVAKLLKKYSELPEEERSVFIDRASQEVDMIFITNAFYTPPPTIDSVGYYDIVRCIFKFFEDMEAEEVNEEWIFNEGINILKSFYDALRDMKFLVIYNVKLEGLSIPYTIRATEYHEEILRWIDEEADKMNIINLRKMVEELIENGYNIETVYKYDIPPDIKEMLAYILTFQQNRIIHSIKEHIDRSKRITK